MHRRFEISIWTFCDLDLWPRWPKKDCQLYTRKDEYSIQIWSFWGIVITAIQRWFDSRSIPIRRQIDCSTTIRQPTLRCALLSDGVLEDMSLASRTISIVLGLGLGLVDKRTIHGKLSAETQRLFCVPYCRNPATSAPVERVFSHSGLIMRPHRARMSDRMLSDLVMLK